MTMLKKAIDVPAGMPVLDARVGTKWLFAAVACLCKFKSCSVIVSSKKPTLESKTYCNRESYVFLKIISGVLSPAGFRTEKCIFSF